MPAPKDHYLAAFKDLLAAKDRPHVAVDPAKAGAFAAAGLVSFDLLIHSETGPNLLAVVRGRKFSTTAITPIAAAAHGGGPKRRAAGRAWDNSITRPEIESLQKWQLVFGPAYRAAVVFAYWIQGPPQRAPFEDVHLYRERHYAFVAAWLDDYLARATPRSAGWRSLTLAAEEFAALARDAAEFL